MKGNLLVKNGKNGSRSASLQLSEGSIKRILGINLFSGGDRHVNLVVPGYQRDLYDYIAMISISSITRQWIVDKMQKEANVSHFDFPPMFIEVPKGTSGRKPKDVSLFEFGRPGSKNPQHEVNMIVTFTGPVAYIRGITIYNKGNKWLIKVPGFRSTGGNTYGYVEFTQEFINWIIGVWEKEVLSGRKNVRGYYSIPEDHYRIAYRRTQSSLDGASI